mmetsp:Transcript_3873/g.8141  ORF Transcript_3873/g.8141 Transcript_3873/m.8141 type:complete len:202 (-) Transcript_3873:115-720(-)
MSSTMKSTRLPSFFRVTALARAVIGSKAWEASVSFTVLAYTTARSPSFESTEADLREGLARATTTAASGCLRNSIAVFIRTSNLPELFLPLKSTFCPIIKGLNKSKALKPVTSLSPLVKALRGGFVPRNLSTSTPKRVVEKVCRTCPKVELPAGAIHLLWKESISWFNVGRDCESFKAITYGRRRATTHHLEPCASNTLPA